MTDQLTSIALPRPAAAPDAGPLDDRLYDLVETRVRRLISDNPILATYLGIHTEDSRLGDASRDAVLAEIAADRAHLAEIEALDDAGLSPAARFERDLELHNLRLGLYEHDEIRRWERRSTSAGELGDAIFLLFARGAAPLSERLARIADRLEEAPAFLEQGKTRAVGQQVAIWQRTEARYAADLPSLFAEVRAAAEGVIDGAELEAARAGHRRRQRRAARPTRPGSSRPSPTPATTGRWAPSATTSWSACGPSATSTPTRSSRSARTSSRPTSRDGARRRASSTPTPTCRRSSSG